MSFSVKAGNSPHQHASSGNSSVNGPPYISPNLGYRGGGGGGGASGNGHTNPPPFTLGEAATTEMAIPLPASKRMGTDPTKYKTTICRNWEQTGACSFRGCTFAHGVDDLRLPARSNTSPPLGPQPQQSPSSTPPMYPQTAASMATANNGNNNGRIEHLLEMLMSEIQKERDLVGIHVDASKSLEGMLRREQSVTSELQNRVEALQNQASELARQVKDRNAEIQRLVEIAGPKLTAEQRARAESLMTWKFASSNDTTRPSSEARKLQDASSRGNNPAAPVWMPPTPPAAPVATKVADERPDDEDSKLKDLLESLRQR